VPYCETGTSCNPNKIANLEDIKLPTSFRTLDGDDGIDHDKPYWWTGELPPDDDDIEFTYDREFNGDSI